LKVLAKIGETTRGQYEYGGRFVEAALGKQAARVWAAANAIISAQMEWKAHTAAATRLIGAWLDAGMPTGDSPEARAKIAEIVDYVDQHLNERGTRSHPLTPEKIKKLRNLLQHADNVVDELVSNAGTGKTVNFAKAWYDPKGVAIDKCLGELIVPDKVFPQGASHRLAELVRIDTQGMGSKNLDPSTLQMLKSLKKAREHILGDRV
jgi:hypothetical protein